ncbi:TRAP transporter small permease [Chloroflexota bacterium]
MVPLIGRILGRLFSATDALAVNMSAALLSVITVMMTYEIFARHLIDRPFFLAELFIMMMLAAIVFLTIGTVTKRDEHIRIGFFVSKVLGDRSKTVMFVLENIAGLALSFYITYAGVKWVQLQMKLGHVRSWSTNPWDQYSEWIPHMVVCVGMGIAAMFYAWRIVRWLRSEIKDTFSVAGIIAGGTAGAGLAILILRVFDWDLMVSGSLGNGAHKLFLIYAVSVFLGALISVRIGGASVAAHSFCAAFLSFVIFIIIFIAIPLAQGTGIDENTIAIFIAAGFAIAAVAGSAGSIIGNVLWRREAKGENNTPSALPLNVEEKA